MKRMQDIEIILESCQTPFYLFDEGSIARRIEYLRRALPRGTLICYAMKANPFVLQSASRAADLVEVCSPGELSICQSLDVPSRKIVVSGVHKERSAMWPLIAEKGKAHRFTVESETQFELLASLALEAQTEIDVLLRLTSGNQFGMDVDDIRRIARECRTMRSISIRGIQLFSGTQKRSSKRIRRELEHLDGLAKELRDSCETGALEIEYGPGLPISYGDEGTSAAEAKEHELISVLAKSLSEMRYAGAKAVEIGRGIAASCGLYATKIVDVKKNCGYNYAIADGGRHQLTFYDPDLGFGSPACHFLHSKAIGLVEDWSVCGSLCSVNDVMIRKCRCRELTVGDYVVFPNAGAYCMTEGPALFLSRELPRVYLRDKLGAIRLVRDSTPMSVLNTPQDYIHTRKQEEKEEPTWVL